MLNTKKSVHNVKYKLNEKKITQLPMQCSYLESHFIDERKCQMQRQQNKFESKSLYWHKRPLMNYGLIYRNKPLCFKVYDETYSPYSST